MRLEKELSKAPLESDGRTPTYGIDSVTDTPYKGVLYRGKKQKSPEEMVNESILVVDVDGGGLARPIEVHSVLLQSLDDTAFDVNRLYFDRSYEREYAAILNELGLPLKIKESGR
jgi:hypothetical protein